MEEIIKRRRNPSKPGGGKRKNRDGRRDKRRMEAEIRQEEYDGLSIKQKLASPTLGAKERRKLEARSD